MYKQQKRVNKQATQQNRLQQILFCNNTKIENATTKNNVAITKSKQNEIKQAKI